MKYIILLCVLISAVCTTHGETRFPENPCAYQVDPHFCVLHPERMKFYFNTMTGNCEPAGCGIFDSQSDCESVCSNNLWRPIYTKDTRISVSDICRTPINPHYCVVPIGVQKYYYDSKRKACVSGRCGQFESQITCESVCTPYDKPILHWFDYLLPVPDNCRNPVHRGHCNDELLHWFSYHPSGKCVPVKSGICENNDNLFVSQSECELGCIYPRLFPQPGPYPNIIG